MYAPVYDSAVFAWVAKGCSGAPFTLGRYVPAIFPKCVRICHPGRRRSLEPAQHRGVNSYYYGDVKWRSIAREFGTEFSGIGSWGSLAQNEDDTVALRQRYDPPFEGTAEPAIIEEVYRFVSNLTRPQDQCICAFWQGSDGLLELPETLSMEIMYKDMPTDYWMVSSTVEYIFDSWISEFQKRVETSGFVPNMIWPLSRRWFFAVPFETYSSFLGTQSDVSISDLLSSTGVEAYDLSSVRKQGSIETCPVG